MSARDKLIEILVEESLGTVETSAEHRDVAVAKLTERWTILLDCLARRLPDVEGWLDAVKLEQAGGLEPSGDYVRFRRASS
jgi:hypothetical protein